MTREAKVGLLMVAVLVGVFGFLLYKRVHRPSEAFAEQTATEENRLAAEDGELPRQAEDDLIPRRKQKSRIGRDVEKIERNVGKAVKKVEMAAEGAEQLAVDAVDEFNPFAGDKRKREKPKLPTDVSLEDDFAQFQPPQDTDRRTNRNQPLEPAETAFDDVQDQRTPQRLKPPGLASSAEDPFADEFSKTDRVRPIDFTEAPRRERSVPMPNDLDGRIAAQDSRSVPEVLEIDLDAEPRRVRESENGFDQPAREKRQAAPMTFADEGSFPNSPPQARGSVDGEKYVVQPNDNFWSISRKRYGAGRYYMALAVHNRQTISDPKMMKPGVVIATPDVAVLEQRYGDVIPKVAAIDSTSSVITTQSRKSVNAEPAGYFVSNDGSPMYRIGEQDTLTGIAKSHLGRTSRWVQILEMNRNVLRDGNELKIGTVIRLPADASRVQIVGTIREYR